MNLSSFYEVSAALNFALLGFWWVVVQMRHEEFTTDARLRRVAYQVSLSFLLPGLMSLAALLSVESAILWRAGFAAGGVLGAALMIRGRTHAGPPAFARGRWLMIVLYVLLALLAIWPGLPRSLGIDASGIAVEATIVVVFIFLGANLAWGYFMHPHDQPLRGSPPQ